MTHNTLPTVGLRALSSLTDPSMVSAYMYPAGAAGAQAAPQGPAGPTTSPAYSSYQPAATQGYQVGGQGPSLPPPGPCSRVQGPAPVTPLSLQNVASQAPQSLPAISQPPQSSTMAYVGSQSVSMGYQPYGMQVRDGDGEGRPDWGGLGSCAGRPGSPGQAA